MLVGRHLQPLNIVRWRSLKAAHKSSRRGLPQQLLRASPGSGNQRRVLVEGKIDKSTTSSHLLRPIDMTSPARLFPMARRIRRDVHLHIGPTNSGKSYTALLAFKAARTGFYAGPLRMLAREIYDRMEAENIPCNLVTGDEVMRKEGALLNSGTVEMMDLTTEMDVAVIDEIQMLEDPDRGWAWTRSFLGAKAKTLHLCGDPSSEQIVRKLVADTGDTLTVHRYERLSPLVLDSKPLLASSGSGTSAKSNASSSDGKLSNHKKKKVPSLYQAIQPGDCIVCFTKRQVQETRDRILQSHGNKMRCAIIYGSLPPEIRAEQARLFNTPDNGVDFLVASDAIGMGLNLSIKRVIFTTLAKFDGTRMRQLTISEIKQIAGRAGRFRTSTGSDGVEGSVVCLKEKDLPAIKHALVTPTPTIERAVLLPHPQVVKSTTVGTESRGVSFSHILKSVIQASLVGPHYRRPNPGTATEIAALFDRVRNLSFDDRMLLSNAPVPSHLPAVAEAFTDMCRVIARGDSVNAMQMFPSIIDILGSGKAVSQALEIVHKTLTLFLWLSYRFPCNFVDREGATDLRRLCDAQFMELLSKPNKALSEQRSAQKNTIKMTGRPPANAGAAAAQHNQRLSPSNAPRTSAKRAHAN